MGVTTSKGPVTGNSRSLRERGLSKGHQDDGDTASGLDQGRLHVRQKAIAELMLSPVHNRRFKLSKRSLTWTDLDNFVECYAVQPNHY